MGEPRPCARLVLSGPPGGTGSADGQEGVGRNGNALFACWSSLVTRGFELPSLRGRPSLLLTFRLAVVSHSVTSEPERGIAPNTPPECTVYGGAVSDR